jgi:hypothetical protein
MQLPLDLAPGEINPLSEWCQRWAGRRVSWSHRSAGGFDRSQYRVEEIPEAVAKEYVRRNHYLSNFPAAVRRFGLFVDGEDDGGLVGVAVFGVPMSRLTLLNVFPSIEPSMHRPKRSTHLCLTALIAESVDMASVSTTDWRLNLDHRSYRTTIAAMTKAG